jgi:mercuric ion transport protein
LKKVVGYLLTGTALIACPCHLVFLLPVALGVLGGTALGAVLAANTGLVVAAATIYFVGALGTGLYLLNRRMEKGASYPAPSSGRKSRGQASYEYRERVTRK